MPQMVASFFFNFFHSLWRNLWRNTVTIYKCDGNPSQFSVTNCDGLADFCHNLWRNVTDSVTILWRNWSTPSQNFPQTVFSQMEIVTEYPSQFPSQYLFCDGNVRHKVRHNHFVTDIFRHKFSVTKNCDGLLSVTICVTICDGSVTNRFVTSEIVTEYFPSQFPSQFQLFRHNFRFFPSQIPSQFDFFFVVKLFWPKESYFRSD